MAELNNYFMCAYCGKLSMRKSEKGRTKKYCDACAKGAYKEKNLDSKKDNDRKKAYIKEMKNTLSDVLLECKEQKMTYAEYQKQQTLKKEGHRTK